MVWSGCSTPPLIGISIRPSRYSHDLIKETGDFVVNIPSVDLMKKVDICGVVSGRNADKFKMAGLTQKPSSNVVSPAVNECPVNIECKLRDTIKLGSHDLFLGEVAAIHVDKDMMKKGGGIDCGKVKPFIYALGEYWDINKKIGFYGCSGK